MRILLAALRNALVGTWLVLTAPLRLFSRPRRPEYVRIHLVGDPPYRRAPRRRFRFKRRSGRSGVESLESLRTQLEVLNKDPAVRGVLVHVDRYAAPLAKREVLAALFELVRAAGKEVVGFAVSPTNAEYEVLCACDRILLPPAGRVELVGFSAEVSALGAGLRQLGVSPHFIRRGDYKTAPELFTRDEVSDIQRKTVETFLDERFAVLIEAVASGRELPVEVARNRVDQGPYSAKRALAAGLVDALVNEVDLETFLATPEAGATAGAPSPAKARLGSYAQYASTLGWPPVTWKPVRRRVRVAVVPLTGMIFQGEAGGFPGGPTLVGSEAVIQSLRAAAEDPRAAAILLFINSPGGSALASELILDEVKRAAAKKPLVAYFDRVAASGGYMAALGAKEIWAAPQAVAGSIGVFAGKFDFSGLLERVGIHRTLITRGEHAALLSATRGFTQSETQALEQDIEETYQTFLELVATSRGKSKEEIHARGEGRVYSGIRAKEAGLIDRTGGFEDACRRALELAQRLVPDYQVALYAPPSRRFGWLSFLRSLTRWNTFALWGPWLELPGCGGREEFE